MEEKIKNVTPIPKREKSPGICQNNNFGKTK